MNYKAADLLLRGTARKKFRQVQAAKSLVLNKPTRTIPAASPDLYRTKLRYSKPGKGFEADPQNTSPGDNTGPINEASAFDFIKKLNFWEAAKIWTNLGSGNTKGGIEEMITSQTETPEQYEFVRKYFKSDDWNRRTFPLQSGIGGTGFEFKLPEIPWNDVGKYALYGLVGLAGVYLLGQSLRGKK